MSAELHAQLEKQAAAFLQRIGYPAEALVYEPILLPIATGLPYRPDLGILDSTQNDYLAVFEVKGSGDTRTVEAAATQLASYVRALGPRPINSFLAVPGNALGTLQFYRVGPDGKYSEVRSGDFPSYESLRTEIAASTRTAARAGLRETTDRFRHVAWSVAGGSLLLVGADVYLKEIRNFSLLSAERLALLGIAAALVLIPFAAKLKAFGLEFERARPENKSP
jgi:hypothetical protein